MNVRELIKLLKDVDQELEIIVKDDSGTIIFDILEEEILEYEDYVKMRDGD